MKTFVTGARAMACMVIAITLFAVPSEAQVVINELHYHPEDPNSNAEFIELHNSGGVPVDVSGWTLSGFAASTFTFPASTSIAADGYVVVAHDAALLQTLTGFLTPHEWPTGNLSNGGETIILADDLSAVIDSVSYDDAPPWPGAPDGSGPSLELIHPDFDNSSGLVWGASTVDNGTPGAQNSVFSESPIVQSESPARLSVVESLPTVSVIFSEPVTGVVAGDLSVNGSAATAVSGSGAGPYDFSGFAAPTTAPITVDLAAGAIADLDINAFGGASWLYPNVVINELHYHPADPNGDAEFIEVLNAGTIPADISGWLLDFGPVPFQFPAATTLTAGETTVVAMNPTLLQTLTGYLAPHQWLAGALSNGGELVTLSISLGVEADRVDYGDQNDPPWPAEPDGDGPSLELIHPSLDNTLPLAWKASAAANGTPGAANSAFDAGPIVIAESPARGSFIGAGLTEVSVTFHEDVTGVDPGDLIIDGAAATGVTGSGAGPYVFTVPAPTSDQVTVTLGPGAIADLAANPFSGDSWQYVLALPEVVINEIHYNPADTSVLPGEDPQRLQFLELYNNGFSPVDLTGWRLTDGVSFDFPPGTSIAADEYILIAKDGAFLTATVLTIPGGTQVFDWDGGDLDNGGEAVRLSDPFANNIDRVEYNDEGIWPDPPDGTGPSLELINPNLLNEYALSWESSSGADGTPGQANSVLNLSPPPVVADVSHDPPIPAGGAPVTITARAFDASPFPVTTMQVCYRQDQSPTVGYTCVAMADDGLSGDGADSDEVFGATLAGLADGQRMDFAIVASAGGGLGIAPRGHNCGLVPGSADCAGANPSEVHLIKFSDAGVPTDFPSYHLIITQVTRDLQTAHNKTEYDGTVVHCQTDGSCVNYYNVVERYRGRGSVTRHPHSYNIRFPDEPIQSEMGFELRTLLLLGMNPHRQALGHDLFDRAGHAAPRLNFVRVVRDPAPHDPGADYSSWVYLNAERVDEDFMRSHDGDLTPTRFPDRCSVSDTVCTTNLDCPGGETCDNTDRGDVYRGRGDGDLSYEGPTVGPPDCDGPYRLPCGSDTGGYQKITNVNEDDWTALIDLTDALTCSSSDSGSICTVNGAYDAAWESTVQSYIDVPEFAAWFALQNILVNIEGGIYRDTGDDYFVALQPSGDHARMIAWDLDGYMGSSTQTIWRTEVDEVERVLEQEAFVGYFVGEICNLLNDEFSQAEMDAAIDLLPEVLFTQPQSSENQGGGPRDRQGMKNWVASRRTSLLGQISMQTTLNVGVTSPYSDPNPVIGLSGALNQCGARRVLVNGVEADEFTIHSQSEAADWSHSFSLVPGVNNIVVQTVDHDGNVIDSAADSVIYSPPGTGGGPASLKVTGPTRMVNTKTHTVRAEILDSLGNTHWQSWELRGTVSARLVSDQTPVPITVTVFETFNGGVGAGGPAPGEILFYNGLGSVSYTIDDPVAVAGQDLEITVTAGGFSESVVVTALDETTPGLFKQLSGTLSGADLTWDPSDGVIHLTGDVTANGLTINPGTLIMVDQGSPGNGVGIASTGVQAIGTEANPIFFFATNGPAAMSLPQTTQNNPPSWQGISHTGSGSSSYAWVFLTGAGNGDVTGHPRPVILGFFNSHSSTIADCVFADNPGKVLHGGGSGTYVVQRSLFSRAGIGGEYFGANHDLTIEDCWFTRNGRAPEPNGVDGDALHLDNASTTQVVRRSIIADCGDDAIDHNASFPVIEDSIIWDVRDKAASLTGGGITFDNVLAFDCAIGIRGGTGTVVVRNTTIATGSSVSGSGPVTIDETITTSGFNLGSCSGNINYTLGPNANHVACGVGNLSGSPGFQDPGNCDYSLEGGSQAANAGPSGGRIGWLGFPEGVICVNDAECDDGNACTSDSCDTGACVYVPIDGCTPCITDGECDDGDPCTTDTCSGGVCTNPPGNDGATCDDGLACTDNDVCGSGTCAGADNCPGGQVCGPLGICIVGQTTYVFQDDGVYTGTEDAHIRQAAPDATHGTLADNTCDAAPCDFFEWDGQDPNPSQNIGLIKFEDITGVGAIAQGSLIDSATLTIVISDVSVAPGAAIHPLLVDWNEGTVTWNNFGGDAGVQVDEYGAQVATAPFALGTFVIDVTPAVQDWINNPATNFGVVILPLATNTNGVKVRSSEYSVIAERPILTVNLPDTGCLSDIDCNDGVFCNGVETCNLGTNTCQGGTPIDCDDGVTCTVDSCNEVLQICDSVPTNSLCDDGSYCSGTETCDAALDCQAGTPVDCGSQLCSDPLAMCVDCLSDLDCPVGEVCTVGAGTCGPPTPADPLPIVIGDEFTYFKGTVEPSPGGGGEATTDWAQISFDDSGWLTGATGFAYGPGAHEASDPDTNTLLDDMSGNYASAYFRRDFHIDNPLAVDTMTLDIDFDDAFVAYINGVEVLRTDLLLGLGDPPVFDQLANAGGGTNHEGDVTEQFNLTAAIPELFAGTNVLSFQLHNVTLGSSDAVLRPVLSATFLSLTCTGDIDCDDTVFCNGVETCNLSTNLCEPGTPVDCDDGVSCTVDACNEGTQSCDNTPTDSICDDANVCTDNTCDALLGCQAADNTDPCQNGDLCTENDVCAAGICTAGTAVDCTDGVSCTDDSCDSGLGCQNVDNCPVGEVCNLIIDICEVPVGPQPGDVIISGFQPSGTPEWIELFNTTNQTISLENLNLIARLDIDPADGVLDLEWQLSDLALDLTGLSIAPYSFFLVGEPTTSPVPDIDVGADGINLATGEGGPAERAISIEATVDAVPVHMDYVLYGRHDGSDSLAIPPGDLAFDGVTFPRVEVTRTVIGTASFAEGVLQRVSQADLHAGYAIEGYYTDEDTLASGFPNGVWTSSLHPVSTLTPRNSGSPPVSPPSPDCLGDIDCDDLQFCNGVETCNLSTNLCEPGTPVDCADAVACTVDTCNETTDSCNNTPDDGACDDSNVCTDNTCDQLLGCQTTDNTDPCEDGDLCTENDVCAGGTCTTGSAVDCDDLISCTTDTCDSGLGCQNVDNCPVGETCNVISDVCEAVSINPLPIVPGDEWQFFKGTAEPTPGNLTDWAQIVYDDSLWLSGTSGLGYDYYVETGSTNGNGDYGPFVGTELDDMRNCAPTAPPLCNDPGYLSVYMRHAFTVTNPLAVTSLTFEIYADDGYVAYLNGVEVDRFNMNPASVPPLFNELATGGPAGGDSPPINRTVDLTGQIGLLVPGTNVLAVQGHNVSPSSRDALFIPQLSSTESVICLGDIDCDDLQFCNGAETCDLGSNTCLPGTPPDCDDGVDCTVDTCNETTDLCENALCPMTVASVGGRYLAVTPPAGLSAVSLRVDSVGIPCLPQYADENGLLVAAPVFRTSAEWGTVFVGDREILPATTYDVSAEVAGPQVVGQVSATTWLWGDANNVDGAELFDILCVQDGFASIFTSCTLEGDDVREGIPDRLIDVDDLMAVLDGVALLPYPDGDPCTGPPPTSSPWQERTATGPDPDASQNQNFAGESGGSGTDTTNLIKLTPSTRVLMPGEEVRVDVFVQQVANLRGYQVALQVLGGLDGLLVTDEIEIATNREDFVFTGLSSFRVIDVEGTRLGAALGEGGVESYDPVYLGTFVLRASDTANGVFFIRFIEQRTFLRDDFSDPIERQLGEEIEIRVVTPDSAETVPSEHSSSDPINDVFNRERGDDR